MKQDSGADSVDQLSVPLWSLGFSRSGLDITQPMVGEANAAGAASEAIEEASKVLLGLEGVLLSRLGLSPQRYEAVVRLANGKLDKNLLFRAATSVTIKVDIFTLNDKAVARWLGIVGVAVTATDGVLSQAAFDRQRSDLSVTQGSARMALRGGGAVLGGLARAKAGAVLGGTAGMACGPLVEVCSPVLAVSLAIVGAWAGSSGGGAGGGVLARRFFGG